MSIRFSVWAVIPVVLFFETACMKPEPPLHVFRMGDKVQVGPLIYNVFEADWRAHLGEGAQVRLPARRFLILHLSVTNGGGETVSVPGLSLIDSTGRLYSESIDGQNVPSWLGLIRALKPAGTLEGNILFDVEPKSYNLKLNDDTDPGPLAVVEMPLRFGLESP